ncbi:MAG: isocitrate lyase/PEP mutase family protein [Rhodospirillaceae bacterium]|nr:isocitrate lyase/PEP mutase family protein [Rhodospirillaceae bacterium]MDD9917842.1 isocitrate lyase/PEP mutase family protein [Rhodospirillaceae bacterium]MDD9929530.1 isocitrate lyase/PEP mutase family protein [Rhodospirillaceae bacterium]
MSQENLSPSTVPADAFPVGLSNTENRTARLHRLIAAPEIVVAPGAFDCITARLVDTAGFPAVYITGSGVSMSALGAPDVGLMSYGEILDRVQRIADVVSIPVIADADTGFGGPLNIMRTVRDFERAGVSAIQIEDQAWPKKCGHEPGRVIVPAAEMVGRIKAAVDARTDGIAIIARTDARSTEGLDAAIERSNLYAEAGADILFLESPESEAELETLNRQLTKPTLANMVEGGRTPVLPYPQLQDIGFSVAIFPNSLTRLLGRTGALLMAELKRAGTTAGMAGSMLDHTGLWDLFDNKRWRDLEDRYGAAELPGGRN